MSVKLPEDNPSLTNDKVDFDNNNKLIPAEADEDKRSTNTKSKEGAGKETPRKDRTDDEEDKEVGKYDTFSNTEYLELADIKNLVKIEPGTIDDPKTVIKKLGGSVEFIPSNEVSTAIKSLANELSMDDIRNTASGDGEGIVQPYNDHTGVHKPPLFFSSFLSSKQ